MTDDEVTNLREVLKAVSYELRCMILELRSPSVEGGYCQSMNFIAALLLSHMDNELAFYTQICMTRDLFNGYFTDELVFLFHSSPAVWNARGRAHLCIPSF